MRVLVIIPAFNEEENILKTVTGLKEKCPDYDYVVINDCSTDSTLKLLDEEKINHLSLPVNLGIGGCVQTGYKYALENGYDIAVQMDGDGQHNPEYIPALISPIEKKEADMTVGSRFIEKKGFQTSFMRRLGIKWISGVIKLCCGLKITDTTSGFRAANKDLIALFSNDYAKDYPEPEAIVLASRHGYAVKEVPVVMNEREGGVSSIRAFKSVYYMIKVTIALFVVKLSVRKRRKK